MVRRYLDASSGTYDLFRSWLPLISIVIVLGHLGFCMLNLLQNQSESFWLRGIAILAMLPYVACKQIEMMNGAAFLRSIFLFAIFTTGPLFLLAGLFNELRNPNPEVVVVVRREFEFLASLGVFLLASVDLVVALWIGFVLSIIVILAASALMTISWETLQPTWITLMSGYIVIYIALVLIARRKSDQAASRSELSEAIGSSIAHELRTPLLSIRTKARALEEVMPDLLVNHGSTTIPNDRRRSLLAKAPRSIVDEAESATTLIDIFLMNVTGPKNQSPSKQVFSLDNAIREALLRYPYRSERERTAIECNDIPTAEVRGPEILMVHIVFNLLKNSFEKLGAEKSPVIEINSWIEKGSVKLSFMDNGPGIDPKDMNKIFEPFYTNSEFGTGVGLAFCKAAIENQFAGSIGCESEPGKYTKMILKFPISTHAESKK